MKNQISSRLKGFSLIELLVVITIVAVLLAVMLPSIAQAREMARRTLCLSNQRQYGISVTVHATDFKGYYPGILSFTQEKAGNWYDNSSHLKSWMWESNKAVAQYIPKPITVCPSADPRFATDKNAWSSDPTGQYFWGATDYSLKVGFGSFHMDGSFDDLGYFNEFRMHDGTFGIRGYYQENWRFPHKRKGFFLNWRVEQPANWGVQQHSMAVMLYDRQRSPAFSPWDGNATQMYRANHVSASLPNGGAEGANALFKDGSARWMYLAPLWNNAAVMLRHYYDESSYAEGSYSEYVDDAIADLIPFP